MKKITRNYLRARELQTPMNLTGFSKLTSVQNRKYLSSKKNTYTHMHTSLKIRSCCPKSLSCPNFVGAADEGEVVG